MENRSVKPGRRRAGSLSSSGGEGRVEEAVRPTMSFPAVIDRLPDGSGFTFFPANCELLLRLMRLIGLTTNEDDDAAIISVVQRLIHGVVSTRKPKDYCVVRIDNWFGH